MKLSYSAVLATALAPFLSYGYLTEGQMAIIAANSKPDKTKAYVDRLVANVQANGVDRTGWTATADSSQTGNAPALAIDSNPSTFWESQTSPAAPLPHTITIDMKQNYWVAGVTYLPRQDGPLDGTIGRHIIQLSTDGTNFGVAKAFGLWHDDNKLKTANFSTTQARYIRLQAVTESGGRGPLTTAADINVYVDPTYTPPNPAVVGGYGPTIGFPTVLVAVTVQHGTGAVVGWSSYLYDQFTGDPGPGTTWTTTYNPASGVVSEATISSLGHDMFCPGLSRDALGRAVVTGGNSASAASIYDDVAGTWSSLPPMKLARGYQGQTTLSTGEIFTIGGSFNGGQTPKAGEVYNSAANAWRLLSGCPVQPMLTADVAGIYRQDNHAWLFGWRNGSIFQAGPSKAMNWYTTSGSGGTSPAGLRGNDGDAMCGNAVMYDAVAGSILAVGGSTNYDNTPATSNANIITVPKTVGGTATVKQIGNMHFPRTFMNSVALPNGQVLIAGGQQVPVVFTDTTPVMIPELFDPATLTFTQMAPMAVVRNYHSTAVLLPDASVLIGGGGLCGGCNTNKFDAQIFYPPYWYASGGRPSITSISASTVAPGGKLTITTDRTITQVSLLRYGSATHGLDTDQRRVPLTPVKGTGNTYTVTVPNDSGIMIPGAWMVFALVNGVPSISKTVLVSVV